MWRWRREINGDLYHNNIANVGMYVHMSISSSCLVDHGVKMLIFISLLDY